MIIKLTYLILVTGLLASIDARVATAQAQGTAFTYSGNFDDGASPASGTYDLEFTLFTAPTNGVAVGSVTNLATTVANGYFSVVVDFGPVFNGSNYWMQLAESTNGAGMFNTLSPLQPLQSVPTAVYATSAATALLANSVAGANITGTVPLAQLPAGVVTNNQSGVVLGGVFSGAMAGSGSGLTNVNTGALVGTLPGALLPAGVVTNVLATNALLPSIAHNTLYVPTNVAGGGVTNGQVFNGAYFNTNTFNGVFTSSVNYGAMVENYAGSAPWEFVQRPVVGTAVASLRPLNLGTMAVDFMPNGIATDLGYGMAWQDICAVDCISNNPGVLPSLHLSAHANFLEISSVSYNGGTALPLLLGYGGGVNDTPFLEAFPATGQINFGYYNSSPQFTMLESYIVGGEFGINTTSPAGNIEIQPGTSGTTESIILRQSTSGGFYTRLFQTNYAGSGLNLPATVVFTTMPDVTNGMAWNVEASGVGAAYRWALGNAVVPGMVFSSTGLAVSNNVNAPSFTASTSTGFSGNGAGLTNLSAGQLSGSLPASVLPSGVVTNVLSTNALVPTIAANVLYLPTNTLAASSLPSSMVTNVLSTNALVASIAANTLFLPANAASGGMTNGQVLTGAVFNTNAFDAVALSSINNGAMVENYPGTAPWELVQRPVIGTAVAAFRPLNTGVMAVDFMPNGNASDVGYGLAWQDICSVDCISNNPNPLPSLHLSVHANLMEISTVSYNGGTAPPLMLGYGGGANDTPFLEAFPANGQINFGYYNSTTPQFTALESYYMGGEFGINTTTPAANIDIRPGLNASEERIIMSQSASGNNSYWVRMLNTNAAAYDGLTLPASVEYLTFSDLTNGINWELQATGNNAIYRWGFGNGVPVMELSGTALSLSNCVVATGFTASTATGFTGNGAGLTNLAAGQLSGSLPVSILPSTVVTSVLATNALLPSIFGNILFLPTNTLASSSLPSSIVTNVLSTNALVASIAGNTLFLPANGTGAGLSACGALCLTNTVTATGFNATAGTGFSGNGAGLTNLAAGNLIGTIADSLLSTNVALQNQAVTFNNPSNVFVGAFIGNGRGLTNLPVASLAGTIADCQLSTNIPLQNQAVTFNNPSNVFAGFFTGNGAGLTNLPAGIITGVVTDGQLSTNVALQNQADTFNNPRNVFVGTFTGNGAGLTNLPISVLTGIMADSQLSTNIPRLSQPNTFTNWHNTFVGTFTGNAAGLTNLPVSMLSGTIADSQLSTNVALQNQANIFSNPSNVFVGSFTGNAAGLTNLTVTNLNGTLVDSQLSTNIARLNQANNFGNPSNVFVGTFTGNGAGLTNLAVTSLSGPLADSQLSTNIARVNQANMFGNPSNVFVGTFTGNGAGLTNLPAGIITGVVADSQLSTNVPLQNQADTFNNPSNVFVGTFMGNGSGLTNLAAANLTGSVPLAALANAITNWPADGFLFRGTTNLASSGPTINCGPNSNITNFQTGIFYGFTGSTNTGTLTNLSIGTFEVDTSFNLLIDTEVVFELFTNGVPALVLQPGWTGTGSGTYGRSTFGFGEIYLPVTGMALSVREVSVTGAYGFPDGSIRVRFIHP